MKQSKHIDVIKRRFMSGQIRQKNITFERIDK